MKSKIEKLKEVVSKSDINTEAKVEILRILNDITGIVNLNQHLLKMHKQVPLIYYAAAIYGLGSAIYGLFCAIYFAVVCGSAVFLIALIAILEVVYKRRKIKNIG